MSIEVIGLIRLEVFELLNMVTLITRINKSIPYKAKIGAKIVTKSPLSLRKQ
jgi:hypothetical protein